MCKLASTFCSFYTKNKLVQTLSDQPYRKISKIDFVIKSDIVKIAT